MKNHEVSARAWAQRAQAELGAEVRFKVLIEELSDLKANHTVINMAKEAMADESRHATLCSEVARELGHKNGYELFSGISHSFEKPWIDNENQVDELLCEMTLMCCITETINASLLSSIYSNSVKSRTQKVIHEILSDEIKHGQMGWAHLAWEAQNRDCRFLGKYLRSMFEISIKDELFLPVKYSLNNEDFNLGVMPEHLRLTQFIQTVNEIVFPGLEKFGIDTTDAQEWVSGKLDLQA